MQIVRGANLTKFNLNKLNNIIKTGAAVTIGNFDGVHLGHQYLFSKLFHAATFNNLTKVCVTFEPHPRDYFNNKYGKLHRSRLTLISDKLALLEKIGFDLVWIINFNKNIANLSADLFITKVISVLRLKYLIVGDDFRFGKNRTGDFNLLKKNASDHKNNYILDSISDYLIDNKRVGSSFIRQLLLNNDLDNDNLPHIKKYLGRYYGFTGKVIMGQGNGRVLGYRTVNIHVKTSQLLLASGVYVVYIFYNNKRYQAMANWGVRPTVASWLELVLEAHIFEFNQEIYNQKIYIEFIKKIREEKKFKSVLELKAQLAVDANVVQEYFSKIF